MTEELKRTNVPFILAPNWGNFWRWLLAIAIALLLAWLWHRTRPIQVITFSTFLGRAPDVMLALAGAIRLLYWLFEFGLARLKFEQESVQPFHDDGKGSMTIFIRQLRFRAHGFQRDAMWSMLIAVAGVGAAFYVFHTADTKIAGAERQSVLEASSTAEAQLEDHRWRERQLRRTLHELQKDGRPFEQFNPQDVVNQKGSEWDEYRNVISVIKGLEVRKHILAKEAENPAPKDDFAALLFSILVTKIGAVLIILFLVRIYLKVFNLSIRFATQYLAMADALIVVDVNKCEPRQLAEMLMPREAVADGIPEHGVQELLRALLPKDKAK